MTQIEGLINKSYYQTFLAGYPNDQPIKVLGELYVEQHQDEAGELSGIRFAQGEIYFHNKDFESAIFKWDSVQSDLKPWAMKNIGDAYYELGLLTIAEDHFNAVRTESIPLKIEVLFQLFSIYVRLGQIDRAVTAIKQAISLDPDYPEVTAQGSVFFEDYLDWNNAVELAVNEGTRTALPNWSKALERYVKEGHTIKFQPDYFLGVLRTLYDVDQRRFASLAEALWKSYKDTDNYFVWLECFNDFLLNLDIESTSIWRQLSELYQDTYFELISGKFLMNAFAYLIPNHVSNWFRLTEKLDDFSLVSTTAVLAWNDYNTGQIEASLINEADRLIKDKTSNKDTFSECLQLFESILSWAKKEGLGFSKRLEWIIRQLLDFDQVHVMVAGSTTSGKSDFIKQFIHNDLLDESTSSVVVFKGATEEGYEVRSDEANTLYKLEELKTLTDKSTLVNAQLPAPFLLEHKISVIDTPCLMDQRKLRSHVFQYLPMADRLLVVLNADSSLTRRDLDLAIRLNEQAPDLPIHFILWRTGRMSSIQEMSDPLESMTSEIKTYFPSAQLLQLSAYDEKNVFSDKLASFVANLIKSPKRKTERLTKVLHYINQLIHFLLEKRMETEQLMGSTIAWREDIVTKLDGAYTQVQDLEEKTTRDFKKSYTEIIEQFNQSLVVEIPSLFRECSDLVKVDRDFSTLHMKMNEEMNTRLSLYLQETVLPKFQDSINEWLIECKGTLSEFQKNLEELVNGFNELYGEEKLRVTFDFKVLEDWHRDMGRLMHAMLPIEEVSILLRSPSSKFLMKSAGKLLGPLSKNTDLIHTTYKQFIEHQDYTSIAQSIADECLKPFDLFKRSLERDLSLFFSPSLDLLLTVKNESAAQIKESKETLNNIRKNPEIYRDPLTLFEIKQRQIEWMNNQVKEDNVMF